ncbi:sterol desaturase family protein [Alienimonas californiensis]|uniref:Fatty acid hydroxylase superfamily protein n=1 Tax=Alienimonas californiensis TaxID=2527989 RepID=A0A517P5C5_9PLAN|nr:sterol desaturase family protein [Alienimonas californiensis]QDT14571.1 Fatty acid hydroxylase superfamily protein [Alienimonas californiensis]
MFDRKLSRSFSAGVNVSTGELVWYLLLASLVWAVLYLALRTRLRHRRVASQEPNSRQIARELLHSVRSIAIFGLVTTLVVFAELSGWTLLYNDLDKYGWWWLAVSFLLMVFLHDAYFYWTHRLMHHGRFYRRLHHTHHLSTSPTPWAAYAFSPWEALVQAGIGPLIVFTIPSHPSVFAAFMLWQIAFNVYGHCGYELFPRWFVRSPLGFVLNTSTHHSQHHEKFRSNYGLYFNFWDRVMGTNHPAYQAKFESVGDRSS